MFRQLFEEGLELQKERLREQRAQARAQRLEHQRRHDDQIASMENYYKDQVRHTFTCARTASSSGTQWLNMSPFSHTCFFFFPSVFTTSRKTCRRARGGPAAEKGSRKGKLSAKFSACRDYRMLILGLWLYSVILYGDVTSWLDRGLWVDVFSSLEMWQLLKKNISMSNVRLMWLHDDRVINFRPTNLEAKQEWLFNVYVMLSGSQPRLAVKQLICPSRWLFWLFAYLLHQFLLISSCHVISWTEKRNLRFCRVQHHNTADGWKIHAPVEMRQLVLPLSAGPAQDEARAAFQDGARDQRAAEDHHPERRGWLLPGSRGPAASQPDANGLLPVQHQLSALSGENESRRRFNLRSKLE